MPESTLSTVSETEVKPAAVPTHTYSGIRLARDGKTLLGSGSDSTYKVEGNAGANKVKSSILLPGQFWVYAGDNKPGEVDPRRATTGAIFDAIVRKRSNKETPGAWADKLEVYRVRPTTKEEFAATGAQWRTVQTKKPATKAVAPEVNPDAAPETVIPGATDAAPAIV